MIDKNKDKKDPVVPKKEKEDTVEIKKSVLEKILKQQEDTAEEIKVLRGAADVGRIARIEAARNKGEIIKTAKLSVFEDTIVLGWVKVKDDVFFNKMGGIEEDQTIKLFLDDGKDEKGVQQRKESETMSYRDFSRLVTKIKGEVIEEKKEKDGTIRWVIEIDDGRQFDLPIYFIN